MAIDSELRLRYWTNASTRSGNEYDDYQSDKALVMRSSALRALKEKAQIMGVSEFRRTRFMHSVEAAQIGERLLGVLERRYTEDEEVLGWLPSRSLLAGVCLGHDVGHPPFGHSGEKALQSRMVDWGGFEGNAQTLRILTRLEDTVSWTGINPTRRFILALLKYPAPYSAFDKTQCLDVPPKCYYDSEAVFVHWALSGSLFADGEVQAFINDTPSRERSRHCTFDCSIMECADDIEYGVHDLEDAIAHRTVCFEAMLEGLRPTFNDFGPRIGWGEHSVTISEIKKDIVDDHIGRKEFFGNLINLFVTSVRVRQYCEFDHPLLRLRLGLEEGADALLGKLKELTYDLVIQRSEIQERQRQGQRIIQQLFDELIAAPEILIPTDIWRSYNEDDGNERKVSDYIASKGDRHAKMIWRRFFPGSD